MPGFSAFPKAGVNVFPTLDLSIHPAIGLSVLSKSGLRIFPVFSTSDFCVFPAPGLSQCIYSMRSHDVSCTRGKCISYSMYRCNFAPGLNVFLHQVSVYFLCQASSITMHQELAISITWYLTIIPPPPLPPPEFLGPFISPSGHSSSPNFWDPFSFLQYTDHSNKV